MIKIPEKKSAYIQKYNREIIIAFCALLAVSIRFIFPSDLPGEWFWLNLLLFLFFPAIIIKFLLKEKFSRFGLIVGNWKKGVLTALAAIALFSFLNYFFIIEAGFENSYRIYAPIATSFVAFLWFELLIASVVFFSREFFFRGFLQLGLEGKFGYYAILGQSAIYALLFLKVSWLAVATAFLSAVIAGAMVRFSRSIYYSFAFIWLVSVTADIILIKEILSNLK